MSDNKLPIEKLEKINDIIAQGIDDAGDASEILLAKVTYFLAAHYCDVEAVRQAVAISLEDLPITTLGKISTRSESPETPERFQDSP